MNNVILLRVLSRITDYYLESSDFNGIPFYLLLSEFDNNKPALIQIIHELVNDELIGVIYSDLEINPHILRTHIESTDVQIEHLYTSSIDNSCLYPRPKHLVLVVDKSKYAQTPYKQYLALGEPQLNYRSFDLSILEIYRNDPRYYYSNNDVSGKISIHDKYYQTDEIHERDQILLESFGFSYNGEMNRAVAVFLRYLADLSPEHQQLWKIKELISEYKLHPDYYRNSIIGDWGERVPIFDAFLKEMWLINQMSKAMGRSELFRQDFGEYGSEKPAKFGFLIRPTLEEYNNFILLLDKMLSDNIDRGFFKGEVSNEIEMERSDGKIEIKQKGTIQILDEWVRRFFRFYELTLWEKSISVFKNVRNQRQKPAHKIDDNVFDQNYFKEQRQIIMDAYGAVRTIRMIFENHPGVISAGISVPAWLRNCDFWTF